MSTAQRIKNFYVLICGFDFEKYLIGVVPCKVDAGVLLIKYVVVEHILPKTPTVGLLETKVPQ